MHRMNFEIAFNVQKKMMRKNSHFFAFCYAVMVLKSDFVKRIKAKTSIRVNLIEDKIKHHHQSNNGLWHEQHSNII